MSIDERNRILFLVESGQVSAAEAAQLLDALGLDNQGRSEGNRRVQNRTLRIWMTDTPNTPNVTNTPNTATRQQKVRITATLPTSLVSASLRLLSHLSPQLNERDIRQVMHALEQGATGRVLDVHDLEEGKRLEIFVEQ